MEVVFKLHLPREASSVPVVRRLCRSSLRTLGVEEECLSDLELAVTEACTNVLRHATGVTDEYEVEVRTTGTSVALSVKDAGAGFRPAMGSPDASAVSAPLAESGRGLHLMRVLVDDLRFVSDGSSGTIVQLEKSLSLRSDSPLAQADGDEEVPGAGRRSYTD
jgi:serine/threonine-protein kinase RsbW